jgi:hypothetical protein
LIWIKGGSLRFDRLLDIGGGGVLVRELGDCNGRATTSQSSEDEEHGPLCYDSGSSLRSRPRHRRDVAFKRMNLVP